MKEILFGNIRPFVRSAKKYMTINQTHSVNANYDHLLIYSLTDDVKAVVNDSVHMLEYGDVLIIRPGDQYYFECACPSADFVFVDFDYTQKNCNSSFANLYDKWEKFKSNKIFESVTFADNAAFNSTVYVKGMYSLESKLLEIVREYMIYGPYFVVKSCALMISILSDIAQAAVVANTNNINNENNNTTAKILKYINCNFCKNLTNQSIGKEFAMHPNHINLLIKRRTGYTLHKYLLIRRNSYAVELLEQTTDPIYTISQKCGFKDSKTFTRSFKEFAGITPQAYREKKNYNHSVPESPALQRKSTHNSVLQRQIWSNDVSWGEMIDNACTKAMQIIDLNMIKFMDSFPFLISTSDGTYTVGQKDDMGCGYWTGIYILAYDMTGDRRYHFMASEYIDKLCHRLFEYEYEHFSEMGLLYVPSCVSAYKIGKIEKARIAVIKAADILLAIYKTKDGMYFLDENYLNLDADKDAPIKISAMCNCSVLYWAHEFTGVGYYKKVADDVTDFIIHNLISDDGTVYWNYGVAQKAPDLNLIVGDSTRAISWGLYGLSIRYRWNKDKSTYSKIIKILDKYIPDIKAADITALDSTMLSCLICAIYDVAEEVNGSAFDKYVSFADETLKRLITHASLNPLNRSDGLLGYSYGFKFRPGQSSLSSVVGDYFYFEALTRKKKALASGNH